MSIHTFIGIYLIGFMVATDNGGHVRSFSLNHVDFDSIHARSNERYDALLDLWKLQKHLRDSLPYNKRQRSAIVDKRNEKGIIGECLFRQLAHFDVGQSFMVDSLHNIYIGAFVSKNNYFILMLLSLNFKKRMVGLWLSVEYRHEDWNVSDRIDELADLFHRVRLPSTTTRIPRSLKEYTKFKGNEFRTLLLFGHVIFKQALRKRFYNHFLQLVVIMHIAESRQIEQQDINLITRLSRNFVVTFAQLYSVRHCVQVVHSVTHIAATVHNFGPLPNFTTFQFENDLGN